MIKYIIIAAISFGIMIVYMKLQNGKIPHSVIVKSATASAFGSIFAVLVASLYIDQRNTVLTGNPTL